VLACIASGLSDYTAAAKAHLLMLKQSSRLFKKAAAQAAAAAAAAPQHTPGQQLSCSAAACPAVLTDAHASTAGFLHRRPHAKKAAKIVLQDSQHAQHMAPPAAACAATICNSSTASAGRHCAGMVMRIPMQLQEHRGRLTIAFDLDETLLCTYRIQHCAAKEDTLQLVPSNRPGTAAGAGPCSSSSSTGSSRWPSLRDRSSSGGSNSTGSSSVGSSSYLGSFSVLAMAPSVSSWLYHRHGQLA
jgi:hypothetical protein